MDERFTVHRDASRCALFFAAACCCVGEACVILPHALLGGLLPASPVEGLQRGVVGGVRPLDDINGCRVSIALNPAQPWHVWRLPSTSFLEQLLHLVDLEGEITMDDFPNVGIGGRRLHPLPSLFNILDF